MKQIIQVHEEHTQFRYKCMAIIYYWSILMIYMVYFCPTISSSFHLAHLCHSLGKVQQFLGMHRCRRWKVYSAPDSKVHGANMGPTWALSAPDCAHVGPTNPAIRGVAASYPSRITDKSVDSVMCDVSHYMLIRICCVMFCSGYILLLGGSLGLIYPCASGLLCCHWGMVTLLKLSDLDKYV